VSDGEFSVVIFYPDGTYEYVARGLSAADAVPIAKQWTERPGALLGAIARVLITDGGDMTNFEWRFGEGVTYPRRDASGKFVGDGEATEDGNEQEGADDRQRE
jgi:hypothetical protein